MRYITPVSLLLVATIMGCNSEEATTSSTSQSNADAIAQQKRALALQLSESYAELETTLKTEISAQNLSISVSTLFEEQPDSDFSQQMVVADAQIRSMKGIEDFTEQLLQLRIADASMIKEWQEGQSPLFAFEPKGNDASWQYIEAFDVYGLVHQLDVYQMPDVPVFVVDSNSEVELRAGLQAMRAQMNALGQSTTLTTVESGSVAAQAMARSSDNSAEPISTTVLKKIRLADDKEPWISGAAEIYAIVTGINPSRDEPTIDLVEMPYLDYDKQDYFPNQVMIQWSRYRWGAADLILMEQDDGTDYKELAKLLVKVAEEVLKLIPDPEVQAYAIIPQITGKIIDAIPDGLLVNDDDYVDVFYTLMQDTSYVDHPGASGNAVATFEPLTINPTRP
ncbi:DUF3103 family protein [Vibrio anguillarum]|uniref:DUF3103 family protein n=1 Tax=Vibrio anguillarum TaxID=55601 RepID=A0AAW4AEU5_VIBAN|nr:DUF3103 domain-containing protein [Vibrio anguillarum]AEH35124.1 Hypothetical protein VAA_02999 [Vibrio anguillarum 775]AGU59653.1 hypothetical protein N175_18150 [Vibrio anguillarum M3]ASF93501.1 hypothetical protein CEA93_15790 [Vibrio anguillarum]ATA51488.1 DUF3103 domain-containing protein [Vibrio anguillarum]AVT66549.1 hypothetical protein B5S57_05005 [Vibrio anguillarum]